MSAKALPLMELEVEYSHFHHLMQTCIDPQAAPSVVPGASSHLAAVMVADVGSSEASPFTASEAIDLSTTADDQSPMMPGEKTPAPYGEVPGFLLDMARGKDGPAGPRAKTSTYSHSQSGSAARVCLEKRFNIMSADTPRKEEFSLLTKYQTVETHEVVVQPQIQTWMKTDRANAFEIPSPFVVGVFKPVTSICEQVIGPIPHMAENKYQSFSFNSASERILINPQLISSSSSTEEHQMISNEIFTDDVAKAVTTSRKPRSTHSSRPIKAAKTTPDYSGESDSSVRNIAHSGNTGWRRERHNVMERERRRRIRLYCDELNMLVPFCHPKSDKVTTLQWTTAFLTYINKKHGNAIKEEFMKAVTNEIGFIPESRSSTPQTPVHREFSAVEQ